MTPIQPGDRFGKLVVLKCVGFPKHLVSKINYYQCLCDCGKIKDIRRNHLLAKKTISCGCFRRWQRAKPPGEASYAVLYSICKMSGVSRNLEFTLTKEQHREIVTKNCHYCGATPVSYNYRKLHKIDYLERSEVLANGVDRVDSSLGYTYSNSVPCCSNCNRAKWELAVPDFIAHCYKIVAHQESLKKAG